MSREALSPYPEYLAEADRCKDNRYVEEVLARDQAAQVEWHKHLSSIDQGLNGRPRWYDPRFTDLGDWQTAEVPGDWREILTLQDSLGWRGFGECFSFPRSLAGRPALLLLGAIVDSDITYLNGQVVGTTGVSIPAAKYWIPVGVLSQGRIS